MSADLGLEVLKSLVLSSSTDKFSFNLYFEVQNFLAQPNPTPQEYGLNRNPDGTIIMPRNLVPVLNQEGNSSPLPTFGFVLFF